MSNPNRVAAMRTQFVDAGAEVVSRTYDRSVLVSGDDGEGTPEWRAWIERQKAKQADRLRRIKA